MREILFRGKRCDNGEWAQGYYIRAEHHWHKHGIHKDWIVLGASANGGWFALHNKYAVKAETVSAFSGLTDKNGKKIFEGDVIKIPDDYDEFGINAGEIYEVYFAFGGFRLKPKYSKGKGFWLEDDKTVEVIGNIHDNPELLENS